MTRQQSLLVYRDAEYAVHVFELPAGGAEMMAALMAGSPLAQAATADGLQEDGMVAVFSLLVQNGLIVAREKPHKEGK